MIVIRESNHKEAVDRIDKLILVFDHLREVSTPVNLIDELESIKYLLTKANYADTNGINQKVS